MLDSCRQHDITADIGIVAIQKVNEACERLLTCDANYRFSIDIASLQPE
jgi:uncharacterized zinc-type alcohol dehydrogenase-like protein